MNDTALIPYESKGFIDEISDLCRTSGLTNYEYSPKHGILGMEADKGQVNWGFNVTFNPQFAKDRYHVVFRLPVDWFESAEQLIRFAFWSRNRIEKGLVDMNLNSGKGWSSIMETNDVARVISNAKRAKGKASVTYDFDIGGDDIDGAVEVKVTDTTADIAAALVSNAKKYRDEVGRMMLNLSNDFITDHDGHADLDED